MKNIIANTITRCNNYFTQKAVSAHKRWIPTDLFKLLKKKQHHEANQLIIKNKYRAGFAATLHELINCSSQEGVSRASQETLAQRLNCSPKTIYNHLQRFQADGVLHYTETRKGWGNTNTITLLFVQHLKTHIPESFTSNLNPPEQPLKGLCSGEGKKQKETPKNYKCYIPETENSIIFDDYLPLSEAEKQTACSAIRNIRALLTN